MGQGLLPEELSATVVVPPAPVRVPSQWPLASSVTSAKFKGDNEMKPVAVHIYPGIYLRVEAKETVVEGCATSHRLKWGSLPRNEVGRITQHVRKGE